MSRAAAREIIDGLLQTIGDAAARGEEIHLPAFGKFTVVDRAEAAGRGRRLRFIPAAPLKHKLNG
ncbi:MAG: HU family DNA-binding protein [Allosphingosinicella sp.]|uniref:HU family DNA-binding protein n=1 Tax=Allosphingosinicella sp. TaxID=2823234 RepID=UPI00393CED35